MNLLQLEEGLRTGTITLDLKSHRCNPIIKQISRYVDMKKDWIKELETGTYIDHDKKVWDKEHCDRMIKYLTVMLENQEEPGEHFHDNEVYCFDCGNHHHLTVVDEKTVSLLSYSDFEKKREEKGFKWLDFSFRYDPADIPVCPAKQLVEEKKMVSEINVPSGQLLFTNFFKQDNIYDFPNDIKYNSENSINGLLGRFNLMQYLAQQNIGYGQMGNMSVNVFLNKAGDEIIIGNDYGYDRETDREFTIKHKGFRNLGSISLSVWRWMCGDLEVLQGHGEVVPENIKVNKQTEDDYKDYILTKVKPGTWVIEHYYDLATEDDDDRIYSKLYLKK